ncbi:MAG TPA: T9SS type A sorting domain-containing protein, partial [Cryomorphaceae bacterium]|nr:T9SS type A sorting domain-containing protein [Cryomorphaceae bacterium]
IVKQGFATTDLVEFPVGYYNLNGGDTISVWQKAGLTPETADATEFSVQYFHENAVPGTSYPSNPPEALSPLITASTCNYWDIDRISGTSDAKVRLHWNDSTTCFDIGDPSFLDVSHLNNSDQWESVGVESFSSNSPFDEGFVESLLTGSFSPFTIGTSNGINVLPIQLLSFDARSFDNSQVMLEWVTATETNNDFFTLERSRDGQFFQQIGTVDGAGNSTQELNYSFVDDDPYSGISYYRLKQTDFDGAFTFSNLRAVQIIADDNFDLENVYAAEDGLRLIYLSENQFLTVEIYDLAGKRVHQQRIENRGNSLIYPNLARGVYLIRLSNRNEMVTRKFFY